MRRREFFVASALGSVGLGTGHLSLAGLNRASGESPEPAFRAGTRKILIAGGGFGPAFIKYMAQLTGKTRPKLMYLPTASADKPGTWEKSCEGLNVEASIQNSFISSYRQDKSWGEALLSEIGRASCRERV